MATQKRKKHRKKQRKLKRQEAMAAARAAPGTPTERKTFSFTSKGVDFSLKLSTLKVIKS